MFWPTFLIPVGEVAYDLLMTFVYFEVSKSNVNFGDCDIDGK